MLGFIIGICVGIIVFAFIQGIQEAREATQKEKMMHQEMQKQINAMSQQVDWTFHNSGFCCDQSRDIKHQLNEIETAIKSMRGDNNGETGI